MDIPREVHGPHKYVWVEVYEITLYEETTSPDRGIGVQNWPVTADLESEIEMARADHMKKSSLLMRKDRWEDSQQLRPSESPERLMPCDLIFNADDEFEFITEAVLVFDRDMEQAWDLDGTNEALEAWYNSTLDAPDEEVLRPFMDSLTQPTTDAIRQLMAQDATPDEYAPFLYPLTHETGLDYGLWIAPSEDGFGLDSDRRHSVLKEMQDLQHAKHTRHLEFTTRRYDVP